MGFFSSPTKIVDDSPERNESVVHGSPLENHEKSRWERSWPTIACGAGLFSDGYLNGVIGQVNTILKSLYKDQYSHSSAQSNVNAIAFAGTVVGQLFFGYTSDHYSRKWSLMASTVVLFIFAALSAGAYGGGSINGMLQALTAWRFLLGIGIGGEYPAGSVACAESTGELKEGHRNRWFIMFTNVQIDIGFVMSSFVPMIVVLATTENHLRAAWRICLGLGVIPPLSLLYLRLKLNEPEEFNRESMKNTRTPWLLVLKFYWFRLAVVSLIWFIYDFSAYSFSIYSSAWIDVILGDDTTIWKSFGWNTIVYVFYLPGAIAGAFISDWMGPKMALGTFVAAQGIVGFIMAGCYAELKTSAHIAGFVVVYGVFLSLGEAGPGDNIGLVASKTSATAIRGQYYAIAAASGKIGAFVGTYLFPIIQSNAPGGEDSVRGGQDPFFVSSSLCIFSAFLAFFLLPNIGQDTITSEDLKFRAYLEQHGWDTSQMGSKEYQGRSSSSVDQTMGQKAVEAEETV
ncbi:uncharacterized protein KY384_002765 [Bacidia gigantensis]|uniref:uncharacterized protein n=1 Tax=Bacidia gigantensis TaxID=2732470 RepID=UPI001D036922|nr:uncharacterized protein KY384_002765 [Bacidia gigantensis]KAG8532887.1 hypothetical protein KY384_002765 [Bacidia gigantensis]